jgi:hypothetical protein
MIVDIVTKTIKKNTILNYASFAAMLAFGPFCVIFVSKQIGLAFFFQGGCSTMVFQVAKTIVDWSLVFLVLLSERSLYDWKRLVV